MNECIALLQSFLLRASVRPSVCLSVRPCECPSVHPPRSVVIFSFLSAFRCFCCTYSLPPSLSLLSPPSFCGSPLSTCSKRGKKQEQACFVRSLSLASRRLSFSLLSLPKGPPLSPLCSLLSALCSLLTHSPTHPLTHSPTHPLTHPLALRPLAQTPSGWLIGITCHHTKLPKRRECERGKREKRKREERREKKARERHRHIATPPGTVARTARFSPVVSCTCKLVWYGTHARTRPPLPACLLPASCFPIMQLVKG